MNSDTFLAYDRPIMKYFPTKFSAHAPRCQEAFKAIFTKTFDSLVHLSMKQHILIETITRQHVQVLYIRWFLKAIGNTANSVEGFVHEMDGNLNKESEKLMANLQMQFSYLNSLDKVLRTVTDVSVVLACNLQIGRHNSILKVCAPLLHKYDFNRL